MSDRWTLGLIPMFCILHLESRLRMNTPTWLISLKQTKRPIWLMHMHYDPVGGDHRCICEESNYSNFTELGQESQFPGRSRPEQHGKENKKFPGEQCLRLHYLVLTHTVGRWPTWNDDQHVVNICAWGGGVLFGMTGAVIPSWASSNALLWIGS